MALIPFEPGTRFFDPIWQEVDRYWRRNKEDGTDWLYRVEVEETPEEVIVTAEIPGIERKEDINIQLDDNILKIRGEIRRQAQKEGRVTHHTERYYGNFSRTITLPASVKTDGAKAKYHNGLLEMSFLKDEHPAARRIDVDFIH